ncbi:MAG: sn-glycerol-3-phosphate ABC transporter permease UgpE [Acetobacteraceae bacterium]|nr:sn-glycerol-3-phosphate ABC transporter permease UgpE [Acetobacteraceae bacterium]
MRPASTAAAAGQRSNLVAYLVLGFGVVLFALPVWLAFVGSTHEAGRIGRGDLPLLPGGRMLENYAASWERGGSLSFASPVRDLMWHSFLMAMGVAVGKIAISILSAYAVVFFRFPGRMVAFWLIFITLMLPVEVRIIPTFEVMAQLDLINSWAGLIVPLIASATATLLFRQFFLTIPDELLEAAKIDGAGPLRFLRDVVLPLSATNLAALFVILFIYGWNQYLWPLLVATGPHVETIVIGIVKMIGPDSATDWNLVMAASVLAMLPPVAVVVLMQRWFVRGLVETEK